MRAFSAKQYRFIRKRNGRDALRRASQIGLRQARLGRRRHAATAGKTGRKAVITVTGGRRLPFATLRWRTQ